LRALVTISVLHIVFSYIAFNYVYLIIHYANENSCVCLWQPVIPEQFEPSPVMPKGMEDEDDAIFGGLQGTGDGIGSVNTGEKEILKENSNVAKIKVVVCYYVIFT
jgi:hypothetical protein